MLSRIAMPMDAMNSTGSRIESMKMASTTHDSSTAMPT